MKIEPFKEYFPSLEDLTKKQKNSFNKIKKQLDRDKYIDVQGNISYLFLYIYGITDKLPQEIKKEDADWAIKRLLNIKKLFQNKENIDEYLIEWIGNLYLCKGNIKKALTHYKLNPIHTQTHLANRIMNIKYEYKIPLKAIELLCTKKKITKFGLKHFNEIVEYCNLIIENEKKYRGKDYLQYIGDKYKIERIYNLELFSGHKCNKFPKFKIYCFYAIEEFDDFVTELSRDAENMLREDLDLPKVGEGWISETELYYKIKKYVGDKYNVVNHYSPKWLGRQHLDVCIPALNIAFEYQGKQHFEPVDYFGGEKYYKKQQLRDKTKKAKCDKNEMKLYYVRNGYNFGKIKDIISDNLKKLK